MKALRVEERQIESFDGTHVAYDVVGEGPPVLLANGLGGSWKAWTHQIDYLRDRYRFISWDYRGLYRSRTECSPQALAVEDHARDGLAVLDAMDVERTAVMGWSMGVQVALEMFRQAPERIAALVLVNGVAGRPWESVFDLRVMDRVLPPALRFIRKIPQVADLVTRQVVQWPETVTWAKRIGLAGDTLDEELWHELAGSFSDLDMGVYMRILELLGEHDAHDVLRDIDVPTLVISGDRDILTPRRASEAMVRKVSGAELMVVPGGTHYVAVEYPELLNLRIEKFFEERGYGSGGA